MTTKRTPRALFAVLACAAILLVVVVSSVRSGPAHVLTVGKSTYRLETVTTSEDQAKGLSGRTSLVKNAGMLFTFPTEDDRCFWMKDMRFNIDIIWLDAQKRVTRIEPDLSPSTYPQDYCARAQYIIELNAGEAARSGIRPGTRLDFR